jgi:hypothetical protein
MKGTFHEFATHIGFLVAVAYAAIGGAMAALAVNDLDNPVLDKDSLNKAARAKLLQPLIVTGHPQTCYYVNPDKNTPVSYTPNSKDPIKDSIILGLTFFKVKAVEDGKTLVPKYYAAPLGTLPVLDRADCKILRQDWKMTAEQATAFIEKAAGEFVEQATKTPGYQQWNGRQGLIRFDVTHP